MRVVAGDRPVQVLLAGKAHPRDDAGKRLVQGLFRMKNAPGFAARVAYLDDYDLRMAAHLVRGCDVWINLPRPPLEASGTSGMKNVVNGGLQLSRARRLVGRGLRRRQRLGAVRRRRPRPRRAGRPPRARAVPAARGGGRARVLPRRRRRDRARLGRPDPPLAAHARARVRRRADARGLREQGLRPRADGSAARRRRPGRRRRPASARRRRASASAWSRAGPASAPRRAVTVGVGVTNGVGVGSPPGGSRASSSLRTSVRIWLSAAVDLRVDLVDAVVDLLLPAMMNITSTPTSTTAVARRASTAPRPAARGTAHGSTGTAARSPTRCGRTWDTRAAAARRLNPPYLPSVAALAPVAPHRDAGPPERAVAALTN